MTEKWEEKLVELESAVVDYIRTIPRSDRHKIIRRLHERVRRLEELVEGVEDIERENIFELTRARISLRQTGGNLSKGAV